MDTGHKSVCFQKTTENNNYDTNDKDVMKPMSTTTTAAAAA
jgi:hypothetical protein